MAFPLSTAIKSINSSTVLWSLLGGIFLEWFVIKVEGISL